MVKDPAADSCFNTAFQRQFILDCRDTQSVIRRARVSKWQRKEEKWIRIWLMLSLMFICSLKDKFTLSGDVMQLQTALSASDLYCNWLIRRSHEQRDTPFVIIAMVTNPDGSWQAVVCHSSKTRCHSWHDIKCLMSAESTFHIYTALY